VVRQIVNKAGAEHLGQVVTIEAIRESVIPEATISRMEALEREGAVHTIWTMFTPFIGAICNCRPGDCLGLRTLAIGVETMYRGEVMAVVDGSLCNGCDSCLEPAILVPSAA
jgi:hypothetical protein